MRTTTNRSSAFRVLLTSLLLFVPAANSPAQENDACLECHGEVFLTEEAETARLYVKKEIFTGSIHGDLDCIDCHMDMEVDEFPHPAVAEAVDCAFCHDDVMETFGRSIHSRELGKGDSRSSLCASCHGAHDIRPVAEPLATAAIHQRCAECHVEEGKIYAGSLHGRALADGDPLAPNCSTCHGGHGLLPSSDPNSSISFHNIPRLCGSCHEEGAPVQAARDIPHEHVLKNYSQSIHGEGLYKKGLTVTAVCTSCHTSHNVLEADDPRSTINRDNLAATCTECHVLIEEMHRKVIKGELWEKEPHKIPACVDCHAPHKARKVYYDEGMADGDCLSCHDDPELSKAREGRNVSLHVDHDLLRESMHNGVACAQCHTGCTPSEFRPCSTITEKVDCSVCHTDQVDQHTRSVHGTLALLRDPDAPRCADCHDPHNTLGKTNARSPTFPRNVPDLCGRCHREGQEAARRKKSHETNVIANYAMSVHGKGLLKSGLLVTAVCTNCHTAHSPQPADNPESTVNRRNIPETCSHCHHGIHEDFSRSIHATGEPTEKHPLPTCYDCHSSHTIARTDVADFKTEIITKCGRCHEEVTETYFETYHGKASKLGSEPAAKCNHCHGAHDVLPPTDLQSRLSRDNIVATCQQCHEEAHRRFAGYLTHATHHNRDKYPFLFYTFWGMTALLVGVLSLATVHTLFWLWRSLRTRKEGVSVERKEMGWQVVRFTPFQRALHLTMVLSFLGLAITGMTVKFAYTDWAQVLNDALGGIESAAYLHRLCAILTFGYFIAHLTSLAVLARRRGLRSIFGKSKTMLPTVDDWRELKATWKWFLGRGERPSYGRWTYWEKFDYWAVFWGVAVIGSTGLMLWFPEFFTRFLPGEVLNVATIIHSDEALLAVGFIFTVHFFNTHFRPGKFPMDPVIFSGTMPLQEYKEERRKEYDEHGASLKTLEYLVPPRSAGFLRGVRIFGLCALLLGLTMIGLILYAMVFGYR